MTDLHWHAADAETTESCGARLAQVCRAGGIVHLNGDLGAGKTTFTRGILRRLGHPGAVKSPTYTLVEPYELDGLTIYHFDLYRLLDPGELELMGYREYFRAGALTLVEWPVRGEPLLPGPDLVVSLSARPDGRDIRLQAGSAQGRAWLRELST